MTAHDKTTLARETAASTNTGTPPAVAGGAV